MRAESKRAQTPPRARNTRGGPAAASPQAKGAAGRPMSGGPELDDKTVMQLQQSFGNAGVTNLLGDRGAPEPGKGERLDGPLQEEMEERLGADFSDVEIHADKRSARRHGAEAFTDGRAIVVDPSSFSTGTEQGKDLLAHELAHVVQQRGDGANAAAAKPAGADPATPVPATRERAEQEATDTAKREPDAQPREPVAAGTIQHAESPLANTEMSEEAGERLTKIREAAGEKWRHFDEWWGEHQDSALAKVEEEEDAGEEYSPLTQALEIEMKDSFDEVSQSLRRVSGQLRENDPRTAAALDTAVAYLASGAQLNRDKQVFGLAKIVETIRLFYTLKRAEDAAEKLKRINPTEQPHLAGECLERIFQSIAELQNDIPGGLPDIMRMYVDQLHSGELFPEAGGAVGMDEEVYRQLWKEFERF